MLFCGSSDRKYSAEASTSLERESEIHRTISNIYPIAVSAVLACQDGNIEECEKVSKIESLLIDLCSQNEKYACIVLYNIEALKVSEPVYFH